IEALAQLGDAHFELAIVGLGPLEQPLRAQAQARLGNRVVWLGRKPQNEVPTYLAGADCLVLPSRHDGWGAVVSEALMAGTPAICSDHCGTAEVAQASGCGGIFPAGDLGALTLSLKSVIADGRQQPEQRARLATWARCLGA